MTEYDPNSFEAVLALRQLRASALEMGRAYWCDEASIAQIRDAAGFFEAFMLFGFEGTEEYAEKPETANVVKLGVVS